MMNKWEVWRCAKERGWTNKLVPWWMTFVSVRPYWELLLGAPFSPCGSNLLGEVLRISHVWGWKFSQSCHSKGKALRTIQGKTLVLYTFQRAQLSVNEMCSQHEPSPFAAQKFKQGTPWQSLLWCSCTTHQQVATIEQSMWCDETRWSNVFGGKVLLVAMNVHKPIYWSSLWFCWIHGGIWPLRMHLSRE